MTDVLRRAGPPHLVVHIDPPCAQDPRLAEVVSHRVRRVLGRREDGCVEVVVGATPVINGDAAAHGGRRGA